MGIHRFSGLSQHRVQSGWYSDSLVSLYLLFNLKVHGDNQLLVFIGWLIVLTPVYCGWRWYRLSHDKGGRS